jgi:hypothetical protein
MPKKIEIFHFIKWGKKTFFLIIGITKMKISNDFFHEFIIHEVSFISCGFCFVFLLQQLLVDII